MAATDVLSTEDQQFLEECEQELKDRFTDKDEEFMKVYNAESQKPPIIENWFLPSDRHRNFDRRYRPYNIDQRDRREYGRRDNYNRRGYGDNRRGYDDNNRGYNDDREQGRRHQRQQYY